MPGLLKAVIDSEALARMPTSVRRLTALLGEHLPASSSLPSLSALADPLVVKSVVVGSDARGASDPATLVDLSLEVIVAVLKMTTLERIILAEPDGIRWS